MSRYTLGAMTRIVSGFARSLTLEVPARGTRPTSDRVREALFSALDARDALAEANVLDLYAGSGALGLEAASRGATRVTLVENSSEAAAVCSRNSRSVLHSADGGREPVVTVRRERVESFLVRVDQSYDLVFIDPPYAVTNDALHSVFTLLVPHLAERSVVCVERSTRDGELILPRQLRTTQSRSYGETALHYLELG